jgi:hypothetical protein
MELFAPTENACVTSHRGQVVSHKKLCDMTPLELNRILTDRSMRVTQCLVNQVWEEIRRRETNSAIETARADTVLREDIIAELMAEGKSRHVAENFINTEAKMLAEGKRLGVL